jgi:hypothetical protein
MTQNSDNQPNTTSRLSQGSKTSVGMVLVAFLALHALCICVGLMNAVGSPYFNFISVVQNILFVGLGLTIFLVFRRRESLSQSAKVSLGLILVLWITIYASFVVGFLDFLLDGFFYYDSALYYILAVFVIGMLVSLWYFSDQNFQRRSTLKIHAIIAVLFIVFFVFQYANVRKNQALILQAYQDHYANMKKNQASKVHFLSAERASIYNVQYNFWSDRAYIFVSDSDYGPMPTFWDRSIWGDYYGFELIDGQWQYAGLTGPSSFIIDTD